MEIHLSLRVSVFHHISHHLVSGEPLVNDIVGQRVLLVGRATAGMFSVIETVEIGQSPALRQDCAGQVWTTIIEISRETNDN